MKRDNRISSSATKLVLLFIIGILGLLVAFVVVWATITETVSNLTMALVASFSGVVGVVVGHYFNKTASQQQPIQPTTEKGKEETEEIE